MIRPLAALAAGMVLVACSPLHDLDAVTRGTGGRGSNGGESNQAGTATPSASGTAGSSGAVATGGAPSNGSGGAAMNVAGAGAIAAGSGGDADAAGNGGQDAGQGGASTLGGTPGTGGAGSAGVAGTIGGDAPSLPIDLPSSPVTGTFTVASDATWEVDGKFVPTFEIHTPSASYWLVKSLGMLVSMSDRDSKNPQQWIAYSTGFRPLRGFPSYGTFDTPEAMTTTLDPESQTPTHLRLSSRSAHWRLIWDFYPTHLTLTVNAAPDSFGMAYRGVPAGALDGADRFAAADGAFQSAMLSFVEDLSGPAEWGYVSDTGLGRSLFMIQHGDDALPDRYQVKDNDSAMLSFGDGALQTLPRRFSLGLIDSADQQAVQRRAAFVIAAIH